MSRVQNISSARPHDDLVRLLAKLNDVMLIELGKPATKLKPRAKKPAARCPAAHNRALLDGKD